MISKLISSTRLLVLALAIFIIMPVAISAHKPVVNISEYSFNLQKKFKLIKSNVKQYDDQSFGVGAMTWNPYSSHTYCGYLGQYEMWFSLLFNGEHIQEYPAFFGVDGLEENTLYEFTCLGVHTYEDQMFFSEPVVFGEYYQASQPEFLGSLTANNYANTLFDAPDYQQVSATVDTTDPVTLICATSELDEVPQSIPELVSLAESQAMVAEDQGLPSLIATFPQNLVSGQITASVSTQGLGLDDGEYAMTCVLQHPVDQDLYSANMLTSNFTYGLEPSPLNGTGQIPSTEYPNGVTDTVVIRDSPTSSHGISMKEIMVTEYPELEDRIVFDTVGGGINAYQFYNAANVYQPMAIVRPTHGFASIYSQLDDLNPETQVFMPMGSNSNVLFYSPTELVRVISSCSGNSTIGCQNGYGPGLEFLAPGLSPNGGTAYASSWSTALVAAQLIKVKDARGGTWWDSRHAARETATRTLDTHPGGEMYNELNGFGIIDTSAAIAWSGSLPADPYE